MKNVTIDTEIIARALSKPADYSDNFDYVVDELCARLSQQLKVDFFHNSHMDYSSAQSIELWLNKDFDSVSRQKDAFSKITTFVSSKGSFFTIRCQTRDLLKRWISVPDENRDEHIHLYIQQIETILEAGGYISLPRSVLFQLAEGHLTKLDKLPATVFNVLFTELV